MNVQSLHKNRLLAPVYGSFLGLVLLVAMQLGLNLWLNSLHQQASHWVTHTLIVERSGERLLRSALEQQTNLRGYLVTKNNNFLENYKKEKATFKHNFKALYQLVQDNPLQLQLLDEINKLHTIWQSKFVNLNGVEEPQETLLSGKSLFDTLHTQVDTLLEREEKLLKQRNEKLRRVDETKQIVDILTAGIIIIGVGFNIWLMRQRIEIPLRRLTKVSKAWQAGQMDVQLNYRTNDEIGRLAQTLNQMASQIHQRQEQNKRHTQGLEDLISALSHDLRTPVLALRVTLRSLINGAFGVISDSVKEVLEEARQANEDLLKLIETLLNISRYEAEGSQKIAWEPLNWEQIFSQILSQSQAVFGNKCPLSYKIESSLPQVYGDQIEIRRVLQNLLDNAVRVSSPGASIQMEVIALNDRDVKVSVRDHGPGIAPGDIEKLFHRFIQGRSRRGSAGLGLYLCRQIVEAHGGKIGVESLTG